MKASSSDSVLIPTCHRLYGLSRPWASLKEYILTEQGWAQTKGDEIVLPANKIIRKDRPARGGGVAIIVKMSITCHIMDDLPLKDVVQS